jgi:hypothetical protein
MQQTYETKKTNLVVTLIDKWRNSLNAILPSQTLAMRRIFAPPLREANGMMRI